MVHKCFLLVYSVWVGLRRELLSLCLFCKQLSSLVSFPESKGSLANSEGLAGMEGRERSEQAASCTRIAHSEGGLPLTPPQPQLSGTWECPVVLIPCLIPTQRKQQGTGDDQSRFHSRDPRPEEL